MKTYSTRIYKSFHKSFCTLTRYKYKLTLTSIDKYMMNEDIKDWIAKIEGITLLNLNKGSNKNYCHANITSKLTIDQIRENLKSIKHMGKTLKFRISEVIPDPNSDRPNSNLSDCNSSQSQLVNIFSNSNIESLKSSIKNYIINFFRKKQSSSPKFSKVFTNIFESYDESKIEIIEFERKLYNYEFQINQNKTKKRTSHILFFPLKIYTVNKNYDLLVKKVKEAITTIIENIHLPVYEQIRGLGVWRNVQIKIYDNQCIVTLLISRFEANTIDIEYIAKALKQELEMLPVNSVYLAFSEKIKATVVDSETFLFISGNYPFIMPDRNSKADNTDNASTVNAVNADKVGIAGNTGNIKSTDISVITTDSSHNLLPILPYQDDYYNFLEKVNVNDIFKKTTFEDIIDLSCYDYPQGKY